MARDGNTLLRWGDIEAAILKYHGEQVMSKYATKEDCKLARDTIEGVLYELEYIPAYEAQPLTMDELRQLDGRIVWVDNYGEWGLVSVDDDYSGAVFIEGTDYSRSVAEYDLKCYRTIPIKPHTIE